MYHSVQERDVRDVVEGCWDREAEEQRPRMFAEAPCRSGTFGREWRSKRELGKVGRHGKQSQCKHLFGMVDMWSTIISGLSCEHIFKQLRKEFDDTDTR